MIPYEDIAAAVERFASGRHIQPVAHPPLAETAPMFVGTIEASGPIPIDADAIEEENIAGDEDSHPSE